MWLYAFLRRFLEVTCPTNVSGPYWRNWTTFTHALALLVRVLRISQRYLSHPGRGWADGGPEKGYTHEQYRQAEGLPYHRRNWSRELVYKSNDSRIRKNRAGRLGG